MKGGQGIFYCVQISWVGYELFKSVAQSEFIYVRCATSVLSFSYCLFDCLANGSLRKTADILRCHHWFPCPNDVQGTTTEIPYMTCHCPDLGSTSDWSLRKGNLLQPISQKHYPEIYPELGSDTSSAWNFCARFSVIISRGNQWLLADFSG